MNFVGISMRKNPSLLVPETKPMEAKMHIGFLVVGVQLEGLTFLVPVYRR